MSCPRTPQISALLDAELPPVEAPAVADHLLRCAECATFLRQGRALDAALLLAAAGEDLAAVPAEAPREVWARIGAATRGVLVPAPPQRRPLPAWVLPAAAALLVALGVAFGWQAARSPVAREALAPAGVTRVSLGRSTGPAMGRYEPAQPMDERRFVALASELLAADSRYRDAMAGVLAVARSEAPREGSTEESSWREEELRGMRHEQPRMH